jgi:hypothetical protein
MWSAAAIATAFVRRRQSPPARENFDLLGGSSCIDVLAMPAASLLHVKAVAVADRTPKWQIVLSVTVDPR